MCVTESYEKVATDKTIEVIKELAYTFYAIGHHNEH